MKDKYQFGEDSDLDKLRTERNMTKCFSAKKKVGVLRKGTVKVSFRSRF